MTLTVNGKSVDVSARPDTPLLYVLMNDLRLKGPRFGCGLAQCGSCSVLVNGVETRSCVTAISSLQGKTVVTLEGLGDHFKSQKKTIPIQQAIVDEQAAQCGYCYNGIIVKASELLAKNATPTVPQIRTAMNGHLCRCGTYPRIVKAIQRASRLMKGAAA